MKSFVTINLRREMADIRKEITAHKAVMKSTSRQAMPLPLYSIWKR